jgi:hypothetical protein
MGLGWTWKTKSYGVQFYRPMLRICVWRWHYWVCVNLHIPRDPTRDHLKPGHYNGASANMHSLFALNRHCVKLHIMDVKIRCDLFNTLVRSITSYAYEVWVDSKKIKTIEVVYRWFLKSLLGMWKTTSTSIVLAEFGKFPFQHFAWGQLLLYYNRVSTFT